MEVEACRRWPFSSQIDVGRVHLDRVSSWASALKEMDVGTRSVVLLSLGGTLGEPTVVMALRSIDLEEVDLISAADTREGMAAVRSRN